MNQNPKLTQFLLKLNSGRYASTFAAGRALSSTKGLSEEDKTRAGLAISNYFNPKKAVPPSTEPEESLPARFRRLMTSSHDTKTEAYGALLSAALRGTHSDEDLPMYLHSAIEREDVGVFTNLVNRHSAMIVPRALSMGILARSSRFFSFVSALLCAPLPLHEETIGAVVSMLVSEIGRRASDEEQVNYFEELMISLIKRRPAGLGTTPLTTLVVSFATPVFAQRWLLEHDRDAKSVSEFARRMSSLYLADDVGADALLSLIVELEPARPVVEEIVRVLLARRQLGDAINIAGLVPEEFKPQLYKILLPMVRDYGDVLALVAFSLVFKGLADRNEIKELIQRFLKPALNERIDAVLDGLDPSDTFESVPSFLPPDEQSKMRDTLMHNLGVLARAPRQKHGEGLPSFLEDLLQTITKRPRR